MYHTAKSMFRYLPVGEQSRAWGFSVVSVGFSLIPAGNPYPPGQHPQDHHFTWEQGRVLQDYTFVYIPRGSGVFESKPSGRKRIKAGDLFLLYPGVWHRYRPNPKTGWDEYWVEFTGDYARRLMKQDEFRPEKPVLTVGQEEPLIRLFTDVYETMQVGSFGFEHIIAAKSVEIIARTLAVVRGRNVVDAKSDEVIRKARQEMERGLETQLDMEGLARRLLVSYSWFRRAFRLYTGFAPHQYLLHLRIDRACSLLTHTRLPIYHIAQQTGFESAYYFSRIFKRKTGLAPANFRKTFSPE